MTEEEWQIALLDADARMKKSNGHEYMTALKTRCIHCGKSPNQKGRCSEWFQTWVSRLGTVMRERGIVSNRDAGQQPGGQS